MDSSAAFDRSLDEMATVLKVLSDKTRLQIVGLLAERPRAVEELAGVTGLSAPTISHHLGRLRAADLVTSEREQYYTVYRLQEGRLQEIGKRLGGGTIRISFEGPDAYDRTVLDRFLVEGQLVSIPRQRKKRTVILRHLAALFAADRDYTEQEVNELLGRFHEDVATLRRELICEKFLDRSQGLYRRA